MVAAAGLRPAVLEQLYTRLGVGAAPDAAAGAGKKPKGKGEDRALTPPKWVTEAAAAGRALSPPSAGAAAGRASPAPPRVSDGAMRETASSAARRLATAAAAAAAASTPGSASKAQRARTAGSPSVAGGPRPAPPRAAGAPRARAAAPAAVRRGGSSVTLAGDLPPAPEILVLSERDLKSEFDKIISVFADGGSVTADWNVRIDAMVALEGLARGPAPHQFEEAFDETLKQLKGPLGEQLLDRRSAISRQASHVLAVLSKVLGPRFDAFAAAMLPLLFKIVVVTVQVVAEVRVCLQARRRSILIEVG